jgi:hypothetical protein
MRGAAAGRFRVSLPSRLGGGDPRSGVGDFSMLAGAIRSRGGSLKHDDKAELVRVSF